MTTPEPVKSAPISVPTTIRRPRIFYGWWIVAAACVLWMYGAAYIFTFGIFINVFSKDYGWSMGSLSGAFSVGAIGMGVVGPWIGYLVDRFGPRPIMLIGVTITGTAFLLAQFIDSLVLFYLLYGLMLPVGSGPVFSGGSAATANWFRRRRAFALSLLTTAWVGGGAIITPSTAWLVNQYGWQQATTVFGLLYLVTGLPLCLVIRHKPEPYGYLPDGDLAAPGSTATQAGSAMDNGATGATDTEAEFTISQAVRTRTFWMLALASLGLSMSNSSVTAHQIPLLTHRGFDPQTAANTLGLMALFSALGRPFMGYLGDRYSKRLLLGGFVAMMAAGTLVLSIAQSMPLMYLYALLYGVGFAVFPVTMAMVAEYFGRRFFATIQQTIGAIGVIGFASGPFLVGRFFDATNEYRVAIMGVSLVCLAAAFLYLFSRKPTQQRMPQESPE